LPMPHLLGSLLLSIALHGFGWVSVPRIGEFLIVAQVAIGGAIGARLAKVPFKTLTGYLVDALVSASLVIAVYLCIALIISWFSGITLLNLILSFIPGGIYEVTLLALLFGFDVAFVTFHHVIRTLRRQMQQKMIPRCEDVWTTLSNGGMAVCRQGICLPIGRLTRRRCVR